MGVNALEVRRRVMLAQPHEAVVRGAVASFRTDVVSQLPMEFDLEPIQAGTGDPSPENVRPITGHDGFTRTRTGKNLLDIDALISAPSGKISAHTFKHVLKLKLEPNTKYTLSTSYSDTSSRVLYFNEASQDDAVMSVTPVTKTSSATGELVIGLYNRTGIGEFENKEVTVQLEKGESVTSYQEFGHTYTTTFPTPPGTVYGGHVRDNGDGTYDLTVDYTIDYIGQRAWSDSTSFGGSFYADLADMVNNGDTAYCSALKVVDTGAEVTAGDNVIYTKRNGHRIYAKMTSVGSASAFKTAMGEIGATIVYKLATPIQYTGLSLTALQSLIGQNHVWVDNAESVSVEYWGH